MSLGSVETIMTKLGASEIKQINLPSLILQIFDEEYAEKNKVGSAREDPN